MLKMSRVISKIRCYNPNKKKTCIGNMRHFFYIVNRKYEKANIDRDINTHEIIGDIDSINLENSKKGKIGNYIKEMSKNNINVYRGIASLKESDAIELGYITPRRWQRMLENRIPKIADILGLPINELEWLGVVHYKKGNPHIHYMFWAKNQQIKDCFITTEQQEQIRKTLINYVAHFDLIKLYPEKSLSRDRLRDLDDILTEMKMYDKNMCIGKVVDTKLKNEDLSKIVKKLKCIMQILPKKGSLKYAYLPDNIQFELNSLALDLIDSDENLQQEFNNYVETRVKINNFYSPKKNLEVKKQAEEDALKIISNQFLKLIRNLKKEEYYQKWFIEKLINETYNLFSIENESNEAVIKHNTSELSKQAEKEYAIKKSNISHTEWER